MKTNIVDKDGNIIAASDATIPLIDFSEGLGH